MSLINNLHSLISDMDVKGASFTWIDSEMGKIRIQLPVDSVADNPKILEKAVYLVINKYDFNVVKVNTRGPYVFIFVDLYSYKVERESEVKRYAVG